MADDIPEEEVIKRGRKRAARKVAVRKKEEPKVDEDDDEEDESEEEEYNEDAQGGLPAWENRETDWSEDEKVKGEMSDLYSAVVQAYDDKNEQNVVIQRCWDVYNCKLNENQSYNGSSMVYVPIVHDAIEARVTRYSNQLFPDNEHFADVISSDGDVPYETIALLNHYVSAAKLRESIGPSLIRAGDITGQYSLYVEWCNKKRHTIKKVSRPLKDDETGMESDDVGQVDDIEVEIVEDGYTDVMVLDARDLAILPANVDNVENAEVVAVALRMSKSKVKRMVRNGTFNKAAGKILLDSFENTRNDKQPNADKKASANAGVRTDDNKKSKTALIYQVWAELSLDGHRRRCVMHFGGEDIYLGCKRNPYWNDRIPVITQPRQKVNGTIWGKSGVEPVEQVQYAANDAVNMGLDSAQYALLPIVMTDPEKNPRVGSMVVAMAALWETSPTDTQFVNMPQLWKEAFAMVNACRDQIMASLSVNPAMMVNGGAGKNPTQAEIAQEQQVALQSTADVVALLESGIYSPLLQWMYELDYQFRSKPVTVRKFGTLGIQAQMQQVPLSQSGTHYTFRWYGSESFKSTQQVQSMIAGLNVLRGISPEQLNGRKIDVGPVVEHVVNIIYGPKLAPHVLIDQRHQLVMDPVEENALLVEGFPVMVQPMDDDKHHLQTHYAAMKTTGDPSGFLRLHMMDHIKQMAAKGQAPGGPQQPGAMPVPAGGAPAPAGPGGPPGQPRIGAQPGTVRSVQNPPGAISPDQSGDPSAMPTNLQ